MIEGPGEDPYVGEQMAKAMIEGIQGEELPFEKWQRVQSII